MAKVECCANCVYAWRDLGLIVRGMRARMPVGPLCANRPGHFGVPTLTTLCRVCCNYRCKGEGPDASAKSITLTNGMIAYVDAADYEELSRYTWRLVSGGYAGRCEGRKYILMHRQIMNPPEGMQVDHMHGNRLDNTRAHLRICTPSENALNRRKNAGSTSRYVGVYYDETRKKWIVKIRLNGKYKFVGQYDDEIDAARAYDRAAVERLDDFARLNFPQEWPPQRRAEVRAQRDATAAANPPSPEPKGQDKTPDQSNPASVEANHDSPSLSSPSSSPSQKTEDRGRKTEGRVRSRAASRATRSKKQSRAKTQGRGGQKQETDRERAARGETKKDAAGRRKGPRAGRQR
ncbi:MAG: HNH endonuclease [Phycisphaerales bacterium]